MDNQIEIRRAGGMLLVEVGGLVDKEGVFDIRDAIAEEARVHGHVIKVLIDMRRAVLLITESGIDEMLKRLAMPGQALDVAVGYLLDPSQQELIWAFCIKMAQAGRTRLPFNDPKSARAWLGTSSPALRSIRVFAPAPPAGQQSQQAG